MNYDEPRFLEEGRAYLRRLVLEHTREVTKEDNPQRCCNLSWQTRVLPDGRKFCTACAKLHLPKLLREAKKCL